jgi:chemotaxis protein methyltransferase CheR
MDTRGELQKLVQYLTVGETFFFRYHAHFDTLRQSIIPELVFKTRPEKIRIWSAGCSTGEEPYSIAMAIMESVPDWKKRDIRVIATDINSRSLKRAREGVYSAWKVRVTEQTYLEKYFTRIGESYVVKDEVKSLVDFSYFNLQVDLSPSNEKFDAIFCRNVMIYFTTATIRKLLENFAGSLNSGGHLFLGHSETLSHISTGFERHLHGGSFYYRKKPELPEKPQIQEKQQLQRPKPVPAAAQPAPKPLKSAVVPAVREPSVEELAVKGEQLLNQENYPEAESVFTKILQLNPHHTKASLGIGQVYLAANRTDEALANFNRAIELDDLNAEAYFLRGLLYEMLDRSAEALEEYRKAVLLDMEFIMPHYRLWRLSLFAGDMKTVVREQNNCVRFLEKSSREAVIPFSNGLSREVFLEQLRTEIARVESISD